MISVRATQATRFRAGRKFTPEPVLVDPAELSEAELAAIKGDPVLVVTDAPAPEPEPEPEPEAKPEPEPEPEPEAKPAPKRRKPAA